MYYAKYWQGGETRSVLYDNKTAFMRDTYCPEHEIIEQVDFRIHGNTFAKRKQDAHGLAVEWSYCDPVFSWNEMSWVTSYFEKIGRRYGLLREFRENGLC